MTLVRFNQRPIDRKVNSYFEEFFNQFPSRATNDQFVTNSVPVNIRETEKSYEIEVVAPGIDKADFKVNIDNNLLTISAEKKAETNKEERIHLQVFCQDVHTGRNHQRGKYPREI
jgi:HSP20 family protein